MRLEVAGDDPRSDADFGRLALAEITHATLEDQPITRLPAFGAALCELRLGACPGLTSLAGIERCSGLTAIALAGFDGAWLARELPRLAELPDLARVTLAAPPQAPRVDGERPPPRRPTPVIDAAIAELAALPALLGLAIVDYTYDQRTAYAKLGAAPALRLLSLESTAPWSCADALAPLAQLRELELVRCIDVPPSIGALTALERLVIGGENRHNGGLRKLPSELGQCRALVELVISGKLASLPEQLCACTNLESLSVRSATLTALPQRIGNLARLRKLAVSNCPLETLPASIGELAALRVLELPHRPAFVVPDAFERLTLEVLVAPTHVCERVRLLPPGPPEGDDVVVKDRTRIPADFGFPTKLALEVYRHPGPFPQLARCTRLVSAKLWIGAAAAPDALAALANAPHLVALEISFDGDALPPTLGGLVRLRSLVVGSEIRRLPAELGDLAALESLALHHRGLVELPDAVANLARLRTFQTHGPLPPVVARCRALERLIVHGGAPVAVLAELRALRELRLYGREPPADLPSVFAALAAAPLEVLTIGSVLEELPSEIGLLGGLRELGLASTQLRELPPAVRSLANLEYVQMPYRFDGDLRAQLPSGEWTRELGAAWTNYRRVGD